MQSFLTDLLKHKEEELKLRQEARPLDTFQKQIKPAGGAFFKALSGDGLKIIAEVKPRSPSLGQLEGKVDLKDRLSMYQKYAQAVSVLCDQKYFGGSVELLTDISASITLPTLLKDFVIYPYQVYEARHAGAEAVLLIVKILNKQDLLELNSLVLELGMAPVVEVQTEEELQIAQEIHAQLILINNRNLDTLQMDLSTVSRLVPKISYPAQIIAASGIENGEQLREMRPYASCFLIGSSLMASGDPEAKFEEFLAAEQLYQESIKREE
jgi:indole-3-glycerol phosphate synthase/phosphoribosylanthranilate isomerase